MFRIVGTRGAKENLFVSYVYLKTILGGSCPEASSPPSAVPETSTWQSDTMMAPSGRASWNTNVTFCYHYLYCIQILTCVNKTHGVSFWEVETWICPEDEPPPTPLGGDEGWGRGRGVLRTGLWPVSHRSAQLPQVTRFDSPESIEHILCIEGKF